MRNVHLILGLSLWYLVGCGGSSNPGASTGLAAQFPCINDPAVYEDTAQNLLWLNDANVSTRTGDWQSARNFCLSLDYAGCDSWILPTVSQAQTAYANNSINASAITWNPINEYWLRDPSTSATSHSIFIPSDGSILSASDTAPIAYGCVLYTGNDPAHMDQDGDGFTPSDGDCNDQSPYFHPGATDIPNDNNDTNCNGNDNT